MTHDDDHSMKVAYLGPQGTFSEQAALLARPVASSVEHVPYPSITAAAEAVVRGMSDAAVLPFENSLAGAVGETHDLIIHQMESLSICDEIIIPVEHCLIIPRDADNMVIDVVYSHPQALGQCQRYLQRRFPAARTEATLSTAQAVGRAVEHGDHAAAIAPRRAAERYGGRILEVGIEDDHRNATRFIVVADHDRDPTGDDRTTILFSTANRPGALLRVLQHLAERDINLTRIESRPSRERLGSYLFLVDCDGHRQDEQLSSALSSISHEVERLRIVGSYPKSPRP